MGKNGTEKERHWIAKYGSNETVGKKESMDLCRKVLIILELIWVRSLRGII
jgi:hypothetical protein